MEDIELQNRVVGCPKCGYTVSSEQKFCLKCGSALVWDKTSKETTPNPEQIISPVTISTSQNATGFSTIAHQADTKLGLLLIGSSMSTFIVGLLQFFSGDVIGLLIGILNCVTGFVIAMKSRKAFSGSPERYKNAVDGLGGSIVFCLLQMLWVEDLGKIILVIWILFDLAIWFYARNKVHPQKQAN